MRSGLITVLLCFAVGASHVTAASNRIVGGNDVAIQDYPAAVQVESNTNDFWTQSCGGVILNSFYILSAAHCFSGRNYEHSNRRIRAGASGRGIGGQIFAVSTTVIHSTYNSQTLDGDIVVVRLTNQMNFGATMQQAVIISQGFEFPPNLPATYVGWGTTSATGSNAETLQAVEVLLVDHDTCKTNYQSLPFPRVVTDNMICAGRLDQGGADACRDDAGGPLYYMNFVIGVISWGQGCGQANYPGVNTKVASYSDWIVETAV